MKEGWLGRINQIADFLLQSTGQNFGYDFENAFDKTNWPEVPNSQSSCHLRHQCDKSSIETGEINVTFIESLKYVNDIVKKHLPKTADRITYFRYSLYEILAITVVFMSQKEKPRHRPTLEI